MMPKDNVNKFYNTMYFIHSMYKELIIIKYIIKIKERREAPSIIIYY